MKSMGCLLLLALLPQAAAQQYLFYVGTYTRDDSKGIYAWRFDAKTGTASSLGLVAETPSPSWLILHPNGKTLYAANELNNYQGMKSGAITAFQIEPTTAKLTKINSVPSRGADPCHLALDQTGHTLFVANYSSGNVAAFPIKLDGSIGESSAFVQHTGSGPNKSRQEAPHAHEITVSPDNRTILVNDLGQDKVFVYNFDLTPNNPPYGQTPPGAGPRHLVISKDAKFVYVTNEVASTVTVFSYDKRTGALKALQTVSALPKDFHGSSTTAEIALHPSGKFLYTSNRGADSIAMFTVDKDKGTITPKEWTPTGGKTPRYFGFDPTGKWLLAANQDSNNITIFHADGKTGKLTPSGQPLQNPLPVSILFLPAK